MSNCLQLLWKFISGDLATSEFEKYLYSSDQLENILGHDFYLEVLAVDFRCKKYQVPSLKEKLKEFLLQNFSPSCECIKLRDIDTVGMGHEDAICSTLVEIKIYGKYRRWLSLKLCNKCSQYWLEAVEEWHNDIYCLRRITSMEAELITQKNQWPKYFQSLEELIIIGNNSGTYVIHTSDNPLSYIIKELIDARPSIAPDEIAKLLRIDEKNVAKLIPLAQNLPKL